MCKCLCYDKLHLILPGAIPQWYIKGRVSNFLVDGAKRLTNFFKKKKINYKIRKLKQILACHLPDLGKMTSKNRWQSQNKDSRLLFLHGQYSFNGIIQSQIRFHVQISCSTSIFAALWMSNFIWFWFKFFNQAWCSRYVECFVMKSLGVTKIDGHW